MQHPESRRRRVHDGSKRKASGRDALNGLPAKLQNVMQVATPTYYPIPDAFRMAVVSSRRRCILKFTLPTAKPLPVVANAAPTILRLAIAGHLIALKLSCQLLYLLRLYLLPILPARRSCPLDAFASHVPLRHQTFRRPQGISTSPRLSTPPSTASVFSRNEYECHIRRFHLQGHGEGSMVEGLPLWGKSLLKGLTGFTGASPDSAVLHSSHDIASSDLPAVGIEPWTTEPLEGRRRSMRRASRTTENILEDMQEANALGVVPILYSIGIDGWTCEVPKNQGRLPTHDSNAAPGLRYQSCANAPLAALSTTTTTSRRTSSTLLESQSRNIGCVEH
jgi:hypothetical protein